MPLDKTPWGKRRGFLIVGNYWHKPNVEALEWFVDEIFPQLTPELLANEPIYLVGNKLERVEAIISQFTDNVYPVGWVPELEPYLANAKALLAPITAGAGARTKIIQAMMNGIPVISTTIGAEGIEATHMKDALIADTPEEFAEMMVCLHQDETVWNTLHENGYQLVKTAYSREAVKEIFLESIEKVLDV
jgi:glycosyltransferase involved in cell wall biosynthesis